MVSLSQREFLKNVLSGEFSWDGRVFLELGFGRGESLPEILSLFGPCKVVGVDTSNQAIEASEKRLKGVRNITVVRSDAKFFVKYLVPPESIDGVFCIFPDPFIKHESRRFVDEPFLKRLLLKLKKGGFFYFITDWEDYYLSVKDTAAKIDGFSEKELHVPFVKNTKFGRKWRRRGRRFFELSLEKIIDLPADFFVYPKLWLRAEGFGGVLPFSFTRRKDGHIFKVEKVFKGKDGFILRTLVVDPDRTEMKQFLKLSEGVLETIVTCCEVFPKPVELLFSLLKEVFHGVSW